MTVSFYYARYPAQHLMASEQILQGAADNQSCPSSSSPEPTGDRQQPSCCTADSSHKVAPQTHLTTALPEEQAEGAPENEGHGADTGGQHGGEEGAAMEERKEKTTGEEGTDGESSHHETMRQVPENKEEGHVGVLVSIDENNPSGKQGADPGSEVMGEKPGPEETGPKVMSEETGEDTEPRVAGEEMLPQVVGEETAPQGASEETAPQVVGEETAPQVVGEETVPQGASEETVPQGASEETVPQVAGEETVLQVVGEGSVPWSVGEETKPQVVDEETVPQVAGEGTAAPLVGEDTGLQVVGEETAPKLTDDKKETQASASQSTGGDSAAQVHHNPEPQVSAAGEKWLDTLVHSIVTEATGEGASTAARGDAITVIIQEEEHSTRQVTGEETMTGEQQAGAQVDPDTQVSSDNTHVSGDGETATPEHEETGAGSQAQEGGRSDLEAGGGLVASGEEADREVTPDLDREGTLEPDQPVACREKEWPPLICTGSEVRTVTSEQGDTQQGSVTPIQPSDKTPEMKEREIIEDEQTPTNETPIEREIRLAMEREMTLRQERGISSPIGEPELVEVRRKTISLQPVTAPGKERQLAGAQMQREIQLETQREQDLVELGKVMGTYDRGPQQELQEKKMIFESMKTEPAEVPIKKKQNEPQQQPITQEVLLSNVPVSTNHEAPSKETKKGPSYAEANGSNVIIIDHSTLLRRSVAGNNYGSAPAEPRRSAPADSRRSTPAESYRTNSSGSPLSNSVDSPVSPGSPYQLLRSPSPRSLLEREIEEVKERERELQRQRSNIYGSDGGVVETTQKAQEIAPDVQSVYQPERPSWRKLEVNWPPNKEAEMNGQPQALDSPHIRRQRSTLIESWELGNPNPKDDE
ncbi:hypothetical protein GDO81_022946 [Engystomops pustulosus]|uniref:A-kinase anchor protein 2 C-terminal domain-containing protein n=1 Tax=Engystomops pustulosus TaxID=76066 RepID=A0AAV6ZTE8_ENGPU|nr:hypothetical protein GDO81_022946 [Engystomops pustulosus]